MQNNSFIIRFENEDELTQKLIFLENHYIKIEIDGNGISTKNILFESIYKIIDPKYNFGYNFDALYDVLTDLISDKNLVLIIKNKHNLLFKENYDELLKFNTILIDLLENDGVYIFLN